MEIIIVFSALLLCGPDTIGIFLLTLLVPPADKKKSLHNGCKLCRAEEGGVSDAIDEAVVQEIFHGLIGFFNKIPERKGLTAGRTDHVGPMACPRDLELLAAGSAG